MNWLDWLVIAVYGALLVGASAWFSRQEQSTESYFLGNRSIPWWAIGLSTMATQLGAVSFISAPAFVALKENGGMVWLSYEFAVPLAMIAIMALILPVLHRSKIVSIYAVLEERFDARTRRIISGVFQISRALASGVTLYAVALVLSVTMGIDLTTTIVITGIVTMIYDTLGGIRAVIFTDVIQMFILLAGILLCGGVALWLAGGFESVLAVTPEDRWRAVDWGGTGLGDGRDFGLWPLLIGGFFLYVSYYGCDQSQVQRELAAKNENHLRLSLLFNGLFRFPVVLGYCLMGLFIGAVVATNAEFAAQIPADEPDRMVPLFILQFLPHGVIGLLVCAILAAAMSSIDSALNSLSAATYKDFWEPWRGEAASPEAAVKVSKRLTIAWGTFCTLFALAVGGIDGTVIEAINKIGSAFYGPILATFVLAIAFRGVKPVWVQLGIASGLAFNLGLWIGVPQVSWFWWNVSGFSLTMSVPLLIGALQRAGVRLRPDAIAQHPPDQEQTWRRTYQLLAVYFLVILVGTAVFL